jgi:hypothetical protein
MLNGAALLPFQTQGTKCENYFFYKLSAGSSAASSAKIVATTTIETSTAIAAGRTRFSRASFIHCESPSTELFTVCAFDGSGHVLFGNLYKGESFVSDYSYIGDRAVRFEH